MMNSESLEIRQMVEELKHNIKYLEYSQAQLLEAVSQNPGDMDFLHAISDNEKSIAKKKNKILELEDFLMKFDPAFSIEKNNESKIINEAINLHVIETAIDQSEDSISHNDVGRTEVSAEGIYL